MHLESDEFVVSFDPNRINRTSVLKAANDSGFAAREVTDSVVTSNTSKKSAGTKSNDSNTAEIPDFHLEAFRKAALEKRPLVLDFMAKWCEPCQRIASETFPDPNVSKMLDQCLLVKIDTDAYPALAKKYGVKGLPDIRLLFPDGTPYRKLRGFQPSGEFAKELTGLLGASKQKFPRE